MIKNLLMVLLTFFLASCTLNNYSEYSILISDDAIKKISNIINRNIEHKHNRGEQIAYISASFLGTPYVSNTLIGSFYQKESLVVNLDGIDCFTYIDYVIALTKSSDINSFLSSLVNIRYGYSDVSYYNRKHFFTDWYALVPRNAVEVTSMVSPDAITVKKQLNKKSDGRELIKGLGSIPREITYIPGNAINQKVLDSMQQGDLVGVYSPVDGLDVSHVGIVIKKDNRVLYRNASSLSENNKVVDVSFMEYMSLKPGIIVLRVS